MSFGKRPLFFFFFDTDSFKSIFNFLISLVSTSSSSLSSFIFIFFPHYLHFDIAFNTFFFHHCNFWSFFSFKKYIKDIYSTPAKTTGMPLSHSSHFSTTTCSCGEGTRNNISAYLPPTHLHTPLPLEQRPHSSASSPLTDLQQHSKAVRWQRTALLHHNRFHHPLTWKPEEQLLRHLTEKESPKIPNNTDESLIQEHKPITAQHNDSPMSQKHNDITVEQCSYTSMKSFFPDSCSTCKSNPKPQM